ncbi:unnamed protein product [Chrysoparadoxa australica]
MVQLSSPVQVYQYLLGSWQLSKDLNYVRGTGLGQALPPRLAMPSQAFPLVGGSEGSWKGIASFKCDGTDLVMAYEEEGKFRLRGSDTEFDAGKRLVYDCSGDAVKVFFVDDPPSEDGSRSLRFFHELDFGSRGSDAASPAGSSPLAAGRKAAFEHLCIKDLYCGSMEVTGEHTFTMSWRVTGPSKDGYISASYKRFS